MSCYSKDRDLISVVFLVVSQCRRINSVVASTFEIIKREVFSLPKLAYLPGILVSEPLLVLVLLPANIGLDFARAKVIAHLNRRVLTFAYYTELFFLGP